MLVAASIQYLLAILLSNVKFRVVFFPLCMLGSGYFSI